MFSLLFRFRIVKSPVSRATVFDASRKAPPGPLRDHTKQLQGRLRFFLNCLKIETPW